MEFKVHHGDYSDFFRIYNLLLIIFFIFLKCRDVLKMKNVIKQLADCEEFGYKFETDDTFWDGVEELVAALQSSYNLTVEMQRVGYGLSDFYIGWLRVKKNLSRIIEREPQYDLASSLLKHMDRRAPSLLNSPLLLCSVYLDPRIMLTLSDEQKAKAAMDLCTIHERIKSSKKEKESVNNTLDEILQEYQAKHHEDHNSTNNLIQELSVYETEKPFDIQKPVMSFWGDKKDKYPLLRPIAKLLHAIPSNQCCTERSFNSLSYIRSKYRMSMSPQNLSNVLMVRLNKDIYYLLREERIHKILE